jgi:hypothetical protein
VKTAAYYQDNRAKTLLLANASDFPLQLTAQDEADMVAYLKLLGEDGAPAGLVMCARIWIIAPDLRRYLDGPDFSPARH